MTNSLVAKSFVFLLLILAGSGTHGRQNNDYLGGEYDRAWSAYQQHSLAENYETALRFAQRGYELAEDIFDPVSAESVEATMKLGEAFLLAGQSDRSLPVLELGLSRAEAAHGIRSAELIPLLMLVADAHGQTGNEAGQRNYLLRAEAIVIDEFGTDSLPYAGFALDAGITIVDRFVSTTAGVYLNTANDIFQRELPPAHPDIAIVQYYLGYHQMIAGNPFAALDHLQQAIEILPDDVADLAMLKDLAGRHVQCVRYVFNIEDPSHAANRSVKKKWSVDPNAMIPIERVAPYYPAAALTAGITGFVDATYTVNEEGRPIDIEIIYSCNGPYFDRASSQAIEKFKYKARVENGVAVQVPGVTTRITFAIEP